jgi:hypothetical protein
VRTKVAFGETSHRRAPAVEETFIDRERISGIESAGVERIDDASSPPKASRLRSNHFWNGDFCKSSPANAVRPAQTRDNSSLDRWCGTDRSRCRSRSRRNPGCCRKQTARGDERVLAQVERLGKPIALMKYEVEPSCGSFDACVGNFHVPGGVDETDRVFLRDLTAEGDPAAELEF